MDILGLDENGYLTFVASRNEVDFASFEKNKPEARWIKIKSVEEGLDPFVEIEKLLDGPITDEQGRYNYRISDKGVITPVGEQERKSQPVDKGILEHSITVADRISAMEQALLEIMEG